MNKKLFTRFMPLLFLAMLQLPVSAQLSAVHKDPSAMYQSAMDLFQKEKYSAALKLFIDLGNYVEGPEYSLLKAEVDYYAAICGIELFNEDSRERLDGFLKEHHTSKYSNTVYFYRGNTEFRERKYSKAIKSYEQVDLRELPRDQIDEYYFKLGYSYLRMKKTEQARKSFQKIRPGNKRYAAAVKYYNGHLAYSEGRYDEATRLLQGISDHEVFGEFVPYYLLHIYHLTGNNDGVLKTGPSMVEKANEKRRSELYRIIADAYFNTGNYEDAAFYYEKYINRPGLRIERADYYQAGFASYKGRNYKNAITYFQKVTYSEDSLTQNAYYHLGDCYLKTGEKKYAWNAFKSAFKYSFDMEIKEDALFNYAKLAYELSYNPYNEAIAALQKYIKEYPESGRLEEAYSYLIDLFLSTKNYKNAYEIISKISSLNSEMQVAYQKIAFNHGVELFLANDFNDAIDLFHKAIQYGDNRDLKARAHFWSGEAYYRMKKYDNSLDYYKKFLVLPGAFNLDFYAAANYNIGYIWFKRKDYSEASVSFRKFLRQDKSTNSTMRADALVRTGDCLFKMKQYDQAIKYYDDAIAAGKSDADYSTFQKAIALGVSDRYEDKINVLASFINKYPRSSFMPDAYYELGSTYLMKNEANKALNYFRKVSQEYPNSVYVKESLLKTGLIHYNAGMDDLAIKVFKRVIEDYPGSQESKEALSSLKNIYVDMNRTDEFFRYAAQLSFADISKNEQDSLLYLAAENQYMDGKCKEASRGFNEYLRKFPEGAFALSATFYKAECSLKDGNIDEALTGYEYISEKPKSGFLENSLVKAAEINYRKKHYERALQWYDKLLEQADFKSNQVLAIIGIMRCSHLLGQDVKAVRAAEQVLTSDKVSEMVITEAHMVIAKASLALNDYNKAKSEFRIVNRLNEGEAGAEAMYYLAYLEFREGNNKMAESMAFKVIENYASYDYWIAKSFILLAGIYEEDGDSFQAKETLKSVIENHEGDELVELAQAKLDAIIEKEIRESMLNQPDTSEINEDSF